MHEEILAGQFGIAADSVTEVQGGWAAAAYRVDTAGRRYFLKAYDKGRPTVRHWTARIDHYIPALAWLAENTELGQCVPRPLYTSDGRYKAEDEKGIYLLFPFIEGVTIGLRPLTRPQTVELAGIIGELHRHGSQLPFACDGLEEVISLPFCTALNDFLDDIHKQTGRLRDLLKPWVPMLYRAVNITVRLRDTARKDCETLVLCHTDAHNWNLMQGDRLILIDWEGLCLAPPEADLFMFEGCEFFGDFLEAYSRVHPDYRLNREMLLFYLFRRRMEDIWEFIAQLLYDKPDECKADTIYRSLDSEFAGTEKLLNRYDPE